MLTIVSLLAIASAILAFTRPSIFSLFAAAGLNAWAAWLAISTIL